MSGEALASQLADAGLDVVGIEAELVGGECPYWGCIPSKMMLRAEHMLTEAARIPGIAGASTVEPDRAPVAQRIRLEATDTWDDTVAVDRFLNKGGRFVRGRGRILSPRKVEVSDVGIFEAKRGLVIGSGTTAAIPPIRGLSNVPYWTNREVIETETVPSSLAIIGAGAIGCELGQAFASFGCAVTIVEAAQHPLPGEDAQAGELLAAALTTEGLTLKVHAILARVEHSPAGFTVHLEGSDPVLAEQLLVATGRGPRMAADDWACLGLTGRAEFLPVDARLRVSDGVWAVGDITGKGAFTHVATYQADIVVRDILGREGPPADYRAVPRVTFTDPEVGAVGLTEKHARAQGLDVAIGSAQIPSTSRGWIHKAGNSGLIKLIGDAPTDTVVGAVSAGPAGGEVLGALCVAVHARVPVSQLESMIYAYPTFHRGIQDAIRDLRSNQASTS